MNKVSINRGIVVEVNDNGDKIVVNVEDQRLVKRFYQMIEKLDEIKAEVNAINRKRMTEGEALTKTIEKTEEIMAEIDAVFGEGCCMKVFGDIVPSPYLIVDFFDQMTPIFAEYSSQRKEMIDKKYNRRRKGGKTK